MSKKSNRLRAKLENERRGHLAKQKRLAAETAEIVRSAQDDARLAMRKAERREALRIYVEEAVGPYYGRNKMAIQVHFDPDAFDLNFRRCSDMRVQDIRGYCAHVAHNLARKIEDAMVRYIAEPESRKELGRTG